jgi:hypothetical protein
MFNEENPGRGNVFINAFSSACDVISSAVKMLGCYVTCKLTFVHVSVLLHYISCFINSVGPPVTFFNFKL